MCIRDRWCAILIILKIILIFGFDLSSFGDLLVFILYKVTKDWLFLMCYVLSKLKEGEIITCHMNECHRLETKRVATLMTL